MATLSAIQEQTLPNPGTIYPDTVDDRYFDFLYEHIGVIEMKNEADVQQRISAGGLKKVSTSHGLYTEGVPVEYLDLVLESIVELACDDNQLDCMLWLVQQSSARVYLQQRNHISSGKEHIGNIWIVDEAGFIQLFKVNLSL